LEDGTELPVPEALMKVLVASAGELSEGHSITVLPSDALLTPSEVAELLGLSRPFVVRLLDAGDLPSERLPRSRHRRVRLADVLTFQARRERRREGREAIADAVAAADLPY
jgi:excisionase family DNA binding protein